MGTITLSVAISLVEKAGCHPGKGCWADKYDVYADSREVCADCKWRPRVVVHYHKPSGTLEINGKPVKRFSPSVEDAA